MFARLAPYVLCLAAMLAAGAVHAEPAPTILVLGDSISAAYGIDLERGWVQLLRERLEAEGYPHRVVNGSVSGETTAGGLSRLPAMLRRHQPEVVLVELGGNDGLRALSLSELDENLSDIIDVSRAAGATPVLFEMRIPPNYGPRYTEGFRQTFRTVAQRKDVPLVPFFLAGIAEDPSRFLDDGIHPTAAAQPALLDAVWPSLRQVLDEAAAASATPSAP